jgi:hypothetical protein
MVGQSTKKVDGGRIPGPAAVPQCIEVKLHFMQPNNKAATVALHGRNLGSFVPSVQTANGFLTTIGNAFSSRLGTFTAVGLNLLQVSNRDMSDPKLPEFFSTGAQIAIGTVGTALPADVAAVLTENATMRGRGAKGRIYVPGFATSADTGTGVITATCITALNGLGTDIMGILTAQGLTPCVAKPARQEYIGTAGASHPARGASTIDLSSYACQNNEWDTQRRRGH